jgi:orotidine-5'-phosphate decarboxylase
VKSRGKKVFLDLKFHDIPNTVSGAVEAAAALGVNMLTVHCAGGVEMMRGALKGADAGSRGAGGARPRIIGVTVLTSLAGTADTAKRVLDYSRDAVAAGIDGVVCSPLEVGQVKRAWGTKLLAVVPGIRLAEDGKDDQARVGTPGHAAADGADFIVVGRSVTGSPDPAGTLAKVLREIEGEGR